MSGFDLLLKVGSLAGLVGLVYGIHNNRKNRPRFKFTFEASVVNYDKDDKNQAYYCFTGIIRNQSLQPNTIIRLYLTVWGSKKKGATLRFGHAVKHIYDVANTEDRNELSLPLYFQPKDARRVEIWFPISLTGTQDGKLLNEKDKAISLPDGSSLLMPKHKWEFLIEDTAENMFDYTSGRTTSRELTDLWWTLPNYSNKPVKYGKQICKIGWAFTKYYTARLTAALGFYK